MTLMPTPRWRSVLPKEKEAMIAQVSSLSLGRYIKNQEGLESYRALEDIKPLMGILVQALF